jgi:hypothetical protein
MRIRI